LKPAELIAKVLQIADDVLTILGKGNLDIHDDMAGYAEQYLRWRNQRQKSKKLLAPDAILGVGNTTEADSLVPKICTRSECKSADVKSMYDYIMAHLDEVTSKADNFYSYAPFNTFADKDKSKGYAVVAMAVVETANTVPNTQVDKKLQLQQWANYLIFYREQFINVQPAFDMNRRLFKLLTPFFGFDFRNKHYSFTTDYVPHAYSANADAADYDWGDIKTRWPAIIYLFRILCYKPENLAVMWNQPHFNPAPGFDGKPTASKTEKPDGWITA